MMLSFLLFIFLYIPLLKLCMLHYYPLLPNTLKLKTKAEEDCGLETEPTVLVNENL